MQINAPLILAPATLANFAVNGAIPAAIIDNYSYILINQTTSGVSVTLPAPTINNPGQLLYVSNIGTNSVINVGSAGSTKDWLLHGRTNKYIWDGVSWKYAATKTVFNAWITTGASTGFDIGVAWITFDKPYITVILNNGAGADLVGIGGAVPVSANEIVTGANFVNPFFANVHSANITFSCKTMPNNRYTVAPYFLSFNANIANDAGWGYIRNKGTNSFQVTIRQALAVVQRSTLGLTITTI